MGVLGHVSAARYVIATIVALVIVGCSGPGGAEPVTVAPFVAPKATSTPLVVEPTAGGGGGGGGSGGSGSFYKPPGWDGVSDVDCKDFDTHKHAQSFFKGTDGSKSNDPYRLDNDHDGVACETLP
jgi:hypothetical protein